MPISAAVVSEIKKTIEALRRKKFEEDPIAGPHLSKITSVLSSAYKRHGFILEMALLETLKENAEFVAWDDKSFHVSDTADGMATTMLDDPIQATRSNVPYIEPGKRRLQVDLVTFRKVTRHLSVYEVKRGSGLHDAGKKRQMMRDLICMELLATSYGQAKGHDVVSSRAHILFFYGKCSIKAPFALTGDEMDAHFGFPVRAELIEANDLFRAELHALLAE